VHARRPDREGHVESHGVRIFWEEHGHADRTVLFLPPWQIVDRQVWKLQVPYFARHFRTLVFDPPGNGRSDRPAIGYDHDRMADHARAVLDAAGMERASLVCLSRSAWPGAILAAEHPERVDRLVLTATTLDDEVMAPAEFWTPRDRYEGWHRYNAHYWRAHYREFLEFFMSQAFSEPHSSKAREDGVAWGLGTTPEILIATIREWSCRTSAAELLARIHAPTLIVHGTEDAVRPFRLAERNHAAIPGSILMPFEGSGHCPQIRDPVRYNVAVRDFLQPTAEPARPRSWRRARSRPRRALFVSSPIGLGHSLRDVAIARELRALHRDLEIAWLAQDPVTRVLAARGEMVHPASAGLAGESAHIEAEAGEHDLHVFQAWRAMDEILLANFMVLHDVLEAETFDLVIGDEAWEVDHYLHENPELKRTAFAWLTDFVGWLPMDGDPTSTEARLAADYNLEMIEQVARFPRVRDRALFVGSREDVVDRPFGPGLPGVREWTGAHYDFPGYVLPFDPAEFADRDALRTRLGFGADERVVLAAVGGTAVGLPLLRKIVAACPQMRRRLPELRMIVVTGPRIDPAALPPTPGVEYRSFVPDLYAHLAACDLAIVQGGLSTCMELTATKRPFLYFPLRHHFEQRVHVPHRLARYGAGVQMDYAEADPEVLAHAVAEGLKRPVAYRDVETDGARQAAALIAPLLDGGRR
jgi:pimeloyl-ACP methyl ester carboxylesterase/predicted glycosyltransferase